MPDNNNQGPDNQFVYLFFKVGIFSGKRQAQKGYQTIKIIQKQSIITYVWCKKFKKKVDKRGYNKRIVILTFPEPECKH